MPLWLIRLRDVVWPAVFSAVLIVADIIIALVLPNAVGLIIALGAGAISLALLAQRA
jgi:hypothetical protein